MRVPSSSLGSLFALPVALPVALPAALLVALPVALFAPAAVAADDPALASFYAAETVTAKKVAGPAPETDKDPRFTQAPAATVLLAPQRTVRLNDKEANAALTSRQPTTATVKALVTDQDLAVLVSWVDPTEDRAPGAGASPGTRGDPTAFGDGVALEVPLTFGKGLRLPYIGMGDDQMHVSVTMQRATGTAKVRNWIGRDYVAAGFGSLTRAPLPGSRMLLRRDGDTWRALFIRPLAGARGQSLKAGLVPFALAVWDGEKHDRGGNKALSSWKFLRLEGEPVDAAYLKEMSYGYWPGDRGDLARGKTLVESVCVACHRLGDKRMAMESFAPDLSSIGAISTYGYLRESIVSPSATIVPHLNINRHTSRGGGVDASGAWPANDMYRWHVVGPDGKKTSKMTPFASFPPADIAAMVAFLKTLGVEPAPAPAPAPATSPPAAASKTAPPVPASTPGSSK